MQHAPDSLVDGFRRNIGIYTLKRFAQAFYQNNIAVALALGKEFTRMLGLAAMKRAGFAES
jgi:hypothetical protein